jgi:hypothetical protein
LQTPAAKTREVVGGAEERKLGYRVFRQAHRGGQGLRRSPWQSGQANDTNLTCEQLAIEYKTNTEVAVKKIATNKSDRATHETQLV